MDFTTIEFAGVAVDLHRIPDLVWGPVCEGGLILVAGATALASGHPWLFASLGPTTYEMIEKPELRSARPYNVVVGHLIAIGAGFAGLRSRTPGKRRISPPLRSSYLLGCGPRFPPL